MKKIRKLFLTFTAIFSFVSVYAEETAFHTKTLQYSDGTIELYDCTLEERKTPNYYVTLTQEGDTWKQIDTVIFTNQEDDDWFASVQMFIAKKIFSALEEIADKKGVEQTVMEMRCDCHFIFYKQNIIKFEEGKTAIVKWYYYDPYANNEEGK
ncbi:MAG: hypothetical protein PUJ82_16325 [Spirochaetales bacterium]|nr:hypothetical protein [Spirochaetales bacterium]MDY5914213.1 hypothetical protein [Treponema sp.]